MRSWDRKEEKVDGKVRSHGSHADNKMVNEGRLVNFFTKERFTQPTYEGGQRVNLPFLRQEEVNIPAIRHYLLYSMILDVIHLYEKEDKTQTSKIKEFRRDYARMAGSGLIIVFMMTRPSLY